MSGRVHSAPHGANTQFVNSVEMRMTTDGKYVQLRLNGVIFAFKKSMFQEMLVESEKALKDFNEKKS